MPVQTFVTKDKLTSLKIEGLKYRKHNEHEMRNFLGHNAALHINMGDWVMKHHLGAGIHAFEVCSYRDKADRYREYLIA